jgi:hypothetical protein
MLRSIATNRTEFPVMLTLLVIAAVSITVFFAGQARPVQNVSAAAFRANWTTIRS